MCDAATIIGIVRDIVATVAAATAGIVAVIGLNAWRTQHAAKTNHEQARRLLRALYSARDMVDFIRSPFILAGEFVEARKEAGELNDDSEKPTHNTDKDVALVYQRRWKIASDAFREFETELIEAEVLWESSAKEAANPFRECIKHLQFNIEMYLRAKIGRWWERPQDQERMEKYEKVVYKISDDPYKDEFSGRVNGAVQTLEIYLRPYLKL